MRFNEIIKDKISIILLGWGILSILLYAGLLLFGGGSDWASDATYIPYEMSIVLATIVLMLVVRFYGTKSVEGKVWLLIFIGLGFWTVAELAHGLNVLLAYVSSASVPDVILDNTDYPFLAGYIFIALGFIYKTKFTKVEPDTGKAFIVLALMGTFAIISVFLVIIPTMETTMYAESEKFFIIAYVVLDILLFGFALAIALYWGNVVSKGWYIIAAGLLSMMIADVGYTALDLKGIYFDGAMIELAWIWAYLLIGLAGHYQKKLHESFM